MPKNHKIKAFFWWLLKNVKNMLFKAKNKQKTYKK